MIRGARRASWMRHRSFGRPRFGGVFPFREIGEPWVGSRRPAPAATAAWSLGSGADAPRRRSERRASARASRGELSTAGQATAPSGRRSSRPRAAGARAAGFRRRDSMPTGCGESPWRALECTTSTRSEAAEPVLRGRWRSCALGATMRRMRPSGGATGASRGIPDPGRPPPTGEGAG